MICVIVFLKAALLPSEASRTPPRGGRSHGDQMMKLGHFGK